jgi:hypothetical protein
MRQSTSICNWRWVAVHWRRSAHILTRRIQLWSGHALPAHLLSWLALTRHVFGVVLALEISKRKLRSIWGKYKQPLNDTTSTSDVRAHFVSAYFEWDLFPGAIRYQCCSDLNQYMSIGGPIKWWGQPVSSYWQHNHRDCESWAASAGREIAIVIFRYDLEFRKPFDEQ